MSEPELRTKSGTFKKGVSGNPGGRPRGASLDWCREFAEQEGEEILRKWAKSKDGNVSIKALTLIYAYGFGKPTEHHDITSDGQSLKEIIGEYFAEPGS